MLRDDGTMRTLLEKAISSSGGDAAEEADIPVGELKLRAVRWSCVAGYAAVLSLVAGLFVFELLRKRKD